MPKYSETFQELALSEVHGLAKSKKAEGARFVNIHATTLGEDDFQLTYSFTSGDESVTDNYTVRVKSADVIQSISDVYFAAFFFENETQDLFGLKFDGIVLDFQGNFYQVALEKPMAVEAKDEDMYSVNRKNDAEVRVKGSASAQKGGDE